MIPFFPNHHISTLSTTLHKKMPKIYFIHVHHYCSQLSYHLSFLLFLITVYIQYFVWFQAYNIVVRYFKCPPGTIVATILLTVFLLSGTFHKRYCVVAMNLC